MEKFYDLIDNFQKISKKKVEFDFQTKINEYFAFAQSFLNQITEKELINDILAVKENLISSFDRYLNNFTEEIKNISTTLTDITNQIQLNMEKGYFSSTKSIILPAIEKIFEGVTKDNIWGIQIYHDIVDEIKNKIANAIVPKIQDQIKVDRGGINEIKKIEQILEQKSQEIKISIPKIKEELLANLQISDIEKNFIQNIIPKINKFRELLSKILLDISEGIKNDFVCLYLDPMKFLNDLREDLRKKEAKLDFNSFKESIRSKVEAYNDIFENKAQFIILEKFEELHKFTEVFFKDFGSSMELKSRNGEQKLSEDIITNFEKTFNDYTIQIYEDFTNMIELSSKIRESLDLGYAQARKSIILPEISKIFSEITEEKIYEIEVFNEIVNDIKVRMELDILVKLEKELLNFNVDLGEIKNIKQILEQKSSDLKKNLPKIKRELINNLKTGSLNQKINNKINNKFIKLNQLLKEKEIELKNEVMNIDKDFLHFFNTISRETTLKTEKEKLFNLISKMIKIEADVKPKIQKLKIELPESNRAEFLAEKINDFLIETPNTMESSIIYVDLNGQPQVINSKQDIISHEEKTNLLTTSTSFENPFDVSLKNVNINNIIPYNYKVLEYNTIGVEEKIQPTKTLLDDGLQLSWEIPEIKPNQETKIELELERRISRTLLLNIGDEVNAINTWFRIDPYKQGYAARSAFENFQDQKIENLILEDEIPNTFNIVQIIPIEDVHQLEMNKAGFDQLVLWQYSSIDSGNKIEHFYYLFDRRFFILNKSSVTSKDDGLILEIFRLIEPNIKFYELVVTYFLKFHKLIPEIYIKEIIPENISINYKIPQNLERTIEIQEGVNYQIWKLIPEISNYEFKFGYICSGTSIKSEFPLELYLPNFTISSTKESELEPERQSLFIPELHHFISKKKRGE